MRQASVELRRRAWQRDGRWATAFMALLLLAGCSETRTDGEPSPQATELFVPGPTADPRFKIGRPYAINGIWYRPRVDWTYEEVGVASWYGPQFHKESTANGEQFDMNAVSAAHRTLPLPSIVEVTNLQNGRRLKLRINDRGPFARDRIIDLSRAAAKRLGFHDGGTAKVRVKLVVDESMRLAGLNPALARKAAPKTADVQVAPAAAKLAAEAEAARPVWSRQVASIALPPAGAAAPSLQRDGESKPFVQAGAFADGDNASRAGSRLAHLAPVVITYSGLNGRNLYRVRLGPLTSPEEAHEVLTEVARAGFADSKVIME
ncbi:MAG TPA: septal ring lytic transglycosylase RlpA family protein [Rhodospirillales bacterium]|nr:septal ring lytic transglycosylase RlpA family protein [Rhodospirillales bacterium]